MRLFICLLMLSSGWAKNLKIGYVEFYPYIYSIENKLEGQIVDYATSVFKDYNIIWVTTPLLRVDRSLNNKSIDLFISYFKSEERQNLVDFTSKPYYDLIPAVCTLHSHLPLKLSEVITEKYNRLLYVKGTLKIDQLFKNKYLLKTEIPFKSFEEKSVLLLEKNRVDYAYFGDFKTAVRVFAASKMNIKCQEYPEVKNSLYMVTKKKNPLLEYINEKLEKYPMMKF